MDVEKLRVGLGWDRHLLQEGRPLILGGVEIPHDRGLAGHSDADVLLHAAVDAVLGASGEDDIGTLFPDDEPAYRDANSQELTRVAMRRVRDRGYRVLSLDAVVIAEQPKIRPYRETIRQALAELFQLDADAVNVKAKTGEGVGPEGRQEVIEATVVALLFKG